MSRGEISRGSPLCIKPCVWPTKTSWITLKHDCSGLHITFSSLVVSGAHEARSVQLRATAFDFERFRHLPYMDISSRGESPFVVAAHTCETSATYCVSTRTKRVLLFRARNANSLIVNSYYTRSKDPHGA